MDVRGVRERVVCIGRVVRTVGDEVAAEICAKWIVAQLKVNLSPVWEPAKEALLELSKEQRWGDVVWRVVWNELRTAGEGVDGGQPAWMREAGPSTDQNLDDPWEEERSWRDPSAHKLRSVVSQWAGDNSTKAEVIQVRPFCLVPFILDLICVVRLKRYAIASSR